MDVTLLTIFRTSGGKPAAANSNSSKCSAKPATGGKPAGGKPSGGASSSGGSKPVSGPAGAAGGNGSKPVAGSGQPGATGDKDPVAAASGSEQTGGKPGTASSSRPGAAENFGFPANFGRAGVDFPIYSMDSIPSTSFSCDGRVKGG